MAYHNHDTIEHKSVEEELRESEKRFRILFEESRDAINIVTREGKFVDVNQSMLELFGYTRDELLKLDVLKLYVNPDDRIKFQQTIEQKESVRDYEIKLRRKDGTEIDCLLTSTVRQASDGSILGYQGIIRDITERKRMEEKIKDYTENLEMLVDERTKELRESEARYSAIFEESRDGIYIIARDGEIIDFNRAGLDIFGYTRDEMIGMNVLELYDDPADRSRFKKTIEEKGSVKNYEIKFRKKDGTRIDGLITSSVWKAIDGSILGYRGIVRDISERKEMERRLQEYAENLETLVDERTQALSESEEKLRAILTGIGDIVTIQNRELDIIWVNQTSRDIWGEVIGKKCYEVYKKLPAPCPGCSVDTVFKEGKTVAYESLTSRPDGRNMHSLVTSSPVRDTEGNIVAVVEVSKDITERKKLEWQLKDYTENLEKLVEERTKALRESEKRYHTLFEESRDGIYIIARDGEIIDFNRAGQDIFGYTRDEMIGMNVLELYVDPDERIKFQQDIEKKGSVKDYELKLCKKDRTALDCLITTTVWKDNDGNILGYQGVVRDITELKERTEDLKRKTVELAALNKELESFSYSVSHDLRAPLRSIDGFSEALLEDYGINLDEKGKGYLQRVRASSLRMTELIDALLVLSRVTRSEMRHESVDLSEIAQEMATELQETQPERQVDFIIMPGLVANGDKTLIRSVLENLLGNAWKFTGKKPNARIEFGVTEHAGKRTYFVSDNGAGFDKAYTDKLFGTFQRLHTTDEFSGIGIGLATVKRIIHRHGGQVWAEGEIGKGATFYFTL
jgi:PAS domain S-box-containing protein